MAATTSKVPTPDIDCEANKVSQQDVDKRPWKYLGYRAFSRHLASDDDFFVLRRFDTLHCRILLRLQDELVHLEEKLDVIDDRFSEKGAKHVDNGSFRGDQKPREVLLVSIAGKLEQYDQLLVHFLQLKGRSSAPNLNRKNIKLWLENRRNPIQAKEVEFINANDLITAAKSPKSTARRIFEQHVLAPTWGLFGMLSHREPPPGSPTGAIQTTVVGRDEPVEAIAAGAVFITAALALIVPLWTLAVVDDMKKKLGVITAFLFFFLAVLVFGTLARPFEVLAATAGYSAVLVVFLQFSTGVQTVGTVT